RHTEVQHVAEGIRGEDKLDVCGLLRGNGRCAGLLQGGLHERRPASERQRLRADDASRGGGDPEGRTLNAPDAPGRSTTFAATALLIYVLARLCSLDIALV